MEDIVAVEIRLTNGENRYYLTWGRIQDRVDPAPLAKLALKHPKKSAFGEDVVSARVLWTLHPSTNAPFFFEYFFQMAQRRIPYGPRYEAWRKKMAKAMKAGEEFWYLGHHLVPEQPDEPDAIVS